MSICVLGWGDQNLCPPGDDFLVRGNRQYPTNSLEVNYTESKKYRARQLVIQGKEEDTKMR
jgi:hypothetical protein